MTGTFEIEIFDAGRAPHLSRFEEILVDGVESAGLDGHIVPSSMGRFTPTGWRWLPPSSTAGEF